MIVTRQVRTLIRAAAVAVTLGGASVACASPIRSEPAPKPWDGTPARIVPNTPGLDPAFVTLQFSDSAIRALMDAPHAILRSLPLTRELAVDAAVERLEVYSDDAKLVVVDEMGEHSLPQPEVATFSGPIAGHEDSSLFLSVSPWWVYGYAMVDDRMFVISSGPAGEGRSPVVYEMGMVPTDQLNIQISPCLTDASYVIEDAARKARDRHPPAGGSGGLSGSGGSGGSAGGTREAPCRVARIAFETDHEFLQKFGGDTAKANGYIATLTAAMTDIYKRDVNTRWVVSYSRLWSTPDDPWTVADAGGQLTEFRNYWATKMFSVSRNLAHFISPRGLGGGVAWVGVVCNSQWGYALSGNLAGSFPYPLKDNQHTNWDPFVVAHEGGHNFGTLHTHDGYDPPIDNCGNGNCANAWAIGTIMSYCHGCPNGMFNIKLKFGPRVSERILTYLTDEAACELADLPRFVKQPVDTTANLGASATFTTSSVGPGILSFQWYFEGTPIAGATAQALTLTNVGPQNIGRYVLRTTNQCHTVESNTATLSVRCPSDFNGNLFVDTDDFDAFAQAFAAGDMTADFDKSGFVDGDDYDDFVAAYEAGC